MTDGFVATVGQLLDCWKRSDLDGALAFVADAIVFEPDPKGTRHEGVDAVGALWGKYMTMMTSYDYRIVSALEGDGIAMVEREETVTTARGEMRLPIMAVFRFDAAGKIVAWRDYWDSAMAGSH